MKWHQLKRGWCHEPSGSFHSLFLHRLDDCRHHGQSVMNPPMEAAKPAIRQFSSGATRDADTDKIDFEGFLSPLALERFGQYMHAKRRLPDGSYRDSDNWQLGIPIHDYMKSGWRHFRDWWRSHRGYPTVSGDDIETELCALIFNAQGYLHEILKKKRNASELKLGSTQSSPPHRWDAALPGHELFWQYHDRTGYVSQPAPAAVQRNKPSTPHEQSHPMAAEALRDEYSRDDNSTGV